MRKVLEPNAITMIQGQERRPRAISLQPNFVGADQILFGPFQLRLWYRLGANSGQLSPDPFQCRIKLWGAGSEVRGKVTRVYAFDGKAAHAVGQRLLVPQLEE